MVVCFVLFCLEFVVGLLYICTVLDGCLCTVMLVVWEVLSQTVCFHRWGDRILWYTGEIIKAFFL